MTGQRYRADFSEPQSDGAIVWRFRWMGGTPIAKIVNCRLENLAGDMRRTVYTIGEPDTFFSIPAITHIQGCRVNGYITGDGDGNIVFRHVYYSPSREAPKRLNKHQRRALLDILADINNESIGNIADLPEDMPEWFLDWPIWSAGENMPGYLPDSPYCLFLTERAAKGYCRELERQPGGYVSDYMPTSLREVLAP